MRRPLPASNTWSSRQRSDANGATPTELGRGDGPASRGALKAVVKEEGDTADDVRHRSTVVSTFEAREPACRAAGRRRDAGLERAPEADAQGRPLDGADAAGA